MKNLIMPFLWLAIAFVVVIFSLRVYAEFVPQGPFGNHISYYMADKGLKEWKLEDHKPIVKAQIKTVETRNEEKSTKVPVETKGFDLDKLSFSIAMAETANCTKGYGKEYRNCFGLKNGNTAPCPKIGRNRMCIYENPEQSYEAFKKVWSTWYKTYPTLKQATRWTGDGNAKIWLSNVNHHYEK